MEAQKLSKKVVPKMEAQKLSKKSGSQRPNLTEKTVERGRGGRGIGKKCFNIIQHM